MSLRALALGASLLLGCAIGPNYERPTVDSPPDYRGQIEPAEAASLADLPWWEIFRDPVLVDLVSEALENNYDLVIATTRVEQSRQLVGAARSEFFPQVGYNGGAARQKSPLNFVPNSRQTFNSFVGAFQLAWEIDVWGRIRRSNEAARADLMAAEDFRRGVLLGLVSSVASAYFDLLELDRELEIARDTTRSFESTLELFSRRYEGGVGSKLQKTRAAAALAQAAATIPALEARIFAQENALNVLLGRNPASIPRGTSLDAQEVPPEAPPGLPAALLERRPDVRSAEQDIVAENALIGVALANFFPRIGLTAAYGGASTELKDLVKGSASIWHVAAEVAGPIFQGGLLLSQYRGQKARWGEARARYEQVVIGAFAEVSDRLTLKQKLAEERIQREREVRELQESVRLSLLRYREGLASYYEVLEAQQQLFPAQRQLAATRRDELVVVVALYRALGGGWQLGESWQPVP